MMSLDIYHLEAFCMLMILIIFICTNYVIIICVLNCDCDLCIVCCLYNLFLNVLHFNILFIFLVRFAFVII